MLSIKIAFVFSSIAPANASGVASVIHLMPIPKCLKVTAKSWRRAAEFTVECPTFELIVCLQTEKRLDGSFCYNHKILPTPPYK